MQTKKKTEFARTLSCRKIELSFSEPSPRIIKNGFMSPAKKTKLALISPLKGQSVKFRFLGGPIPESTVNLMNLIDMKRPLSRRLRHSATYDWLPKVPKEMKMAKRVYHKPQFCKTFQRKNDVIQKYSNLHP